MAKSQFDKLLDELGLMVKAIPAKDGDGDADDKKIAAAADAGDDGANADGDGDGDDKGGEEGDGTMAKSMVIKLADGTEVEAVDGSEMIKALQGRLDASEEAMAKALGDAITLLKAQGTAMQTQADMIKSLQDQVAALGNAGKGRKAVVTVAEKAAADATMAKAEQGVTPEQFMAKAMSAFEAGKITGVDVSRCESYVNRGLTPPQELVARIYAE